MLPDGLDFGGMRPRTSSPSGLRWFETGGSRVWLLWAADPRASQLEVILGHHFLGRTPRSGWEMGWGHP